MATGWENFSQRKRQERYGADSEAKCTVGNTSASTVNRGGITPNETESAGAYFGPHHSIKFSLRSPTSA